MRSSNILTIAILAIALFIFTRPGSLPSMDLQVNHNGRPSDLRRTAGGSCDGETCLTIYLSPSCPTSPRLTSMLIRLVDDLEKDNIKTNIIIGLEPQDTVNQFAKRYPFDVSFDASGTFFRKAEFEFTPTFVVTNSSGDILTKTSVGYLDHVHMRKQLKI